MSWERARPFILPALEDGDTEADVLNLLLIGHATLWLGERAAIVTTFSDNPRHLHVWLGGGSLEELDRMRPGIEAYGRAMGCRLITGNGRKGWDRYLKSAGYARDGEVLQKVL